MWRVVGRVDYPPNETDQKKSNNNCRCNDHWHGVAMLVLVGKERVGEVFPGGVVRNGVGGGECVEEELVVKGGEGVNAKIMLRTERKMMVV